MATKEEYSHIPSLVSDIFSLYGTSSTRLSDKVVMAETDPRRIAKSSAPLPAPTIEELVTKQKSRLNLDG